MREYIFDGSTTKEAIEFFNSNKEMFGDVISAEMKSNVDEVRYELTLTNAKNEKMMFPKGLSAGYNGEGCKGTKYILEQCGFTIDHLVSSHSSFVLKK